MDNEEKSKLINRIISVGLNSMKNWDDGVNIIKKLSRDSPLTILGCWENIDDGVKLLIFKENLDEFKKFLESKLGDE